MIKILQVRNVDSFVESRRQKTSEKDRKAVQAILDDVRKNGDSAVKKYEQKFNGRKTTQLRVTDKEIKEAQSRISDKEKAAIVLARQLVSEQELLLKNNLKGFSDSLLVSHVSKSFVPIPSVGCYIPGGQARYPSSVIMSVTTAKQANVERIVVVSPPSSDGKIDPLTITAAKICGATEIYKVGGAQAIGAFHMEQNLYQKLTKLSDQVENLLVLLNHL